MGLKPLTEGLFWPGKGPWGAGGAYFTMTPQAMRGPASPAGSVS
jgi:hypothetical protein